MLQDDKKNGELTAVNSPFFLTIVIADCYIHLDQNYRKNAALKLFLFAVVKVYQPLDAKFVR